MARHSDPIEKASEWYDAIVFEPDKVDLLAELFSRLTPPARDMAMAMMRFHQRHNAPAETPETLSRIDTARAKEKQRKRKPAAKEEVTSDVGTGA